MNIVSKTNVIEKTGVDTSDIVKHPELGDLVPITYHCRFGNSRRSTSTRSGRFNVEIPVAVNSGRTIKLVYNLMWTNSGTGVTENIHLTPQTIQTYVIFPNGEEFPVTFGSDGHAPIASGFGFLISDPITCSVPLLRNQIIRVRSNISVAVAATNVILTNGDFFSVNDAVQWDAASVLGDVSTVATRATAITGSATEFGTFAPIIVGTPTANKTKLGILSHSYFQAYNDYHGTATSSDAAGSGIVGQMLRNKGCSITNLAGSGEFISGIVANGFATFSQRVVPLLNCNRVLIQHFVNDLLSGSGAINTSAAIMANLAIVDTWLRNLGITDIWVMTVPALLASSTNLYKTRAGMTTHSSNAQRLLLNTALRNLYGSKCIDMDAAVVAAGGNTSQLPDATLLFAAKVTSSASGAGRCDFNEGAPAGRAFYNNLLFEGSASTTTVALRGSRSVCSTSQNSGNTSVNYMSPNFAAPPTIADTFDVYERWTVDGIHPGRAMTRLYGTVIAASGVMD